MKVRSFCLKLNGAFSFSEFYLFLFGTVEPVASSSKVKPQKMEFQQIVFSAPNRYHGLFLVLSCVLFIKPP